LVPIANQSVPNHPRAWPTQLWPRYPAAGACSKTDILADGRHEKPTPSADACPESAELSAQACFTQQQDKAEHVMPEKQPAPKQAPTPKGSEQQRSGREKPRFVFTDWASI